MSKRIIIGLVFLMGISLLGIVAVQFYWFNNSVKVRNELFDRSVNEALNLAVRRLETGHDLRIIRNIVAGDSIKWEDGIPPPPPPPPPAFDDIDVMIKKDTAKGRISVITSKSRKLKSEFPEIGNDMAKKIEQIEELSKQITYEYRGWETGRHIDEKLLKDLIKEELVDKAIPIDFSFTIDSKDSINKATAKTADFRKWYKVNLFPNDVFRKNLELALFFPDRDLFIGRTTTLLLGVSVAFTLIIFLTFLLSIILILRQKKISEMKSDFINNMTHEFKTPIATISIAADSIADEKVISNEEKVRFFAGMIKKENIRMNEQVERILQIARLDRKEFEFNFQTVNIHELVNEAIIGIALQVEKKGGKIVRHLDAINPVVMTDPIHFTGLLYNLLDNANKYSPDTPLITVTTANCPKGINLSVEDKGIGMTKAVQTRIFDKFYRLTSGNIHNVKGFGLGLSYVKAILEANNGSIKVYSEPGKGSKFVVFVPFLINKR